MLPLPPEGEMTISALLSLSFTILGGGAGFIATIFAFYVYRQWKNQKRNETIYSTNVALLRHIFSTTVYAGNMLVARANPNTSKVNEHRVNLVSSMSFVVVESGILKSLIPEPEELTSEIMRLNEVSAEIINLRLFPEKDHINKIYVASTHEWSNKFVKSFFDRINYVSWGDLGGRCYELDALKFEIETLAESIKSRLREGL